MFDLETAIAQWRRDLSGAGFHRPEELDELESHLRDDIEHRVRDGVAREDAFRDAVAALGRASALRQEYSKLHERHASSLAKILWISCLIMGPAMFLAGIWSDWGERIGSWSEAVGLAGLFAASAYVVALPFVYLRLPNPTGRKVAIILKLMSLCFAGLPVIALLNALDLIHLHASYTAVMAFSNLYVVTAFTFLAYACRDQGLRSGRRASMALDGAPFHDLAKAALETARDEARRLAHDYIGTEHVLLGILAHESPRLTRLFQKAGLDDALIKKELMNLVVPGRAIEHESRPYTPRASAALNYATEEAQNHGAVGVEHLFLGLLRENEGIAGLVLGKLGLRLAPARLELFRDWDDDQGGAEAVMAG